MRPINKSIYFKHRGAVPIISTILITVFFAPVTSTASLSGVNLQIADNQHKIDSGPSAAESAIECEQCIVANTCQKYPKGT